MTFLEFRNYEIVKNESYIKFRGTNIDIWDEIESILKQLIVFVKGLKISCVKFKANNLLDYWCGKKLSIKDMEKILKISVKSVVNR